MKLKGILKRHSLLPPPTPTPIPDDLLDYSSDDSDAPPSPVFVKRVSFDGPGPQIFQADDWDRTPADVTLKLTYRDVVELKELDVSLIRPGPLAMERTTSNRARPRTPTPPVSPPGPSSPVTHAAPLPSLAEDALARHATPPQCYFSLPNAASTSSPPPSWSHRARLRTQSSPAQTPSSPHPLGSPRPPSPRPMSGMPEPRRSLDGALSYYASSSAQMTRSASLSQKASQPSTHVRTGSVTRKHTLSLVGWEAARVKLGMNARHARAGSANAGSSG